MLIGEGKSAAAPAGVVKDATTASFAKDVMDASRSALVIVDFWASWCGPCKQLTPILERVVRSYGGRVRLVKVNTDEHPAVAAQLRVTQLPTIYAFRDGRPMDGFTGALPEASVRAFIDRLLEGEAAEDAAALLAAADKALAENDLQGAAETYAAVLQVEQQNPAALAGLARCYLKSGDIPRAEQMLALVPPDKRDAAAVESVRSALELAKMAGKADNRAKLEKKLADDPDDHKTRLDLAVALAARGEKTEAVDHLLAIMKRDRSWNDDAARKQLLKLFEAWGPKDPATVDGRRRLSSMLFA